MRKQARECCFQLLFEYLFLGTPETNTRDILLKENNLSSEDAAFTEERLFGVIEQESKLKEIIGGKASAAGYTVDRIYKTDLAALLLGAWELLYTDTPPAVAINEAVELALKFSGEKSGGFVNGILGAILRDKEGISDGKAD